MKCGIADEVDEQGEWGCEARCQRQVGCEGRAARTGLVSVLGGGGGAGSGCRTAPSAAGGGGGGGGGVATTPVRVVQPSSPMLKTKGAPAARSATIWVAPLHAETGSMESAGAPMSAESGARMLQNHPSGVDVLPYDSALAREACTTSYDVEAMSAASQERPRVHAFASGAGGRGGCLGGKGVGGGRGLGGGAEGGAGGGGERGTGGRGGCGGA